MLSPSPIRAPEPLRSTGRTIVARYCRFAGYTPLGRHRLRLLAVTLGIGLAVGAEYSAGQTLPESIAERGRQLLLEYRFLPPDFPQDVLDEVWRDWPEPWRSQAAAAGPDERRRLTFARYGWTPHPTDPTRPVQYVRDAQGWYAMSCFACHGGSVAGTWIPGAPNSRIALATLYEDMRRTKLRLEQPLSPMDLGSLTVPMGGSDGTSNAVVFGIALMAFRNPQLDVLPFRLPRRLVHHDMDAPPWWNVHKRKRLYIDGFVEKNARALIPFVMDQRNSGETMRGWEDEFQAVYAYLQSLRPPRYPGPLDSELAGQGAHVFARHCSKCHGTYGAEPTYPSRIVPLAEIGTDPVRLTALSRDDRQRYHHSWFAHFGADDTVLEPAGYQAPPLDGIWASAPYFHNGSVPTLWHLLRPADRPVIWHRANDEYDHARVGLLVESLQELPRNEMPAEEIRRYFDTQRRGKSAAGHPFADPLTDDERKAVLEYLKTL